MKLPVWALPPMALVIALAVIGFPLRWLWERLRTPDRSHLGNVYKDCYRESNEKGDNE